MQRIIKVFTVLILISFSGHVLAEGVKRPGPNNKLGYTKSNQGDTFLIIFLITKMLRLRKQ